MPAKKITTISIIGAGNVATQLGIHLLKSGLTIRQVYNHHQAGAATLAKKLKAKGIHDLNKLESADMFIISVKDDAITTIVNQLSKNKLFQDRQYAPLIVHTSGSVEVAVLKKATANYGWLYPLQTISKNANINLAQTPIGIDGSNKPTLNKIKEVAGCISAHLFFINQQQRTALHVAAVFTNNFTNAVLATVLRITAGNKIDHQLLVPLLKQTVENFEKGVSIKNQTGPAIRGDKKTIAKHQQFLAGNKQALQLYKAISAAIALKD